MDNPDLQCSVPRPILNAAITTLKNMAGKSSSSSQPQQQPQQQQPDGLFPSIPGLPEEQTTHVRRKKGFKSDPSYSLSSDKNIQALVGGVEEVKEYLFQFSASLDGVQVFANSAHSNSVYVFSLFSENMARRYMVKGLDGFFLFMIYCSETEPRTDKQRKPASSKVIDFGLKTVQPRIDKNRKVKDSMGHYDFSPPDAVPGSKMANQDFHRILKTVLQIMKEKGREGFVIRKGRTAYRCRYAINAIRADMPAGNLFLGFPGRHSSNQPCAQCKLRRRVYDPWICDILMRPELCMHRLQEKMMTLMTSVVGLPPEHPLRLLRFSLWLANHPGSRTQFEAAMKASVRCSLLWLTLRAVLTLLSFLSTRKTWLRCRPSFRSFPRCRK